MILSARHAGRVAIIDFHGRMTLSPAVNRLQKRIEHLLRVKPAAGLVLNLVAVSAMDSAGIGELVKIHRFAAQQGMRVAVALSDPEIREMLRITRLDGIFAVCGDEASALEEVERRNASPTDPR